MEVMGWVCTFVAGRALLSTGCSTTPMRSTPTAVAVFTMGQTGLMYEASVGGQKFSFQPIQTP